MDYKAYTTPSLKSSKVHQMVQKKKELMTLDNCMIVWRAES
jgi:hypothetical protein